MIIAKELVRAKSHMGRESARTRAVRVVVRDVGKEISEFATEQSFIDFGERLCDQCYTDELAVLGLLMRRNG